MNKLTSKYYYCLVMFLIWLPFEVAGQNEVLSLDKCMEIALANNYAFKIQALKVKQAERNKSSVASRFLPQLDANINHQYNFGSAIDPNTNSRVSANFQYDNIGISAQINLFNFSDLWDSKLQAKDFNIEQAQSKVIEQEYILSLIEKFYAAYGTQEWLKTIQQQFNNTEQQVDRIRKEVESGLKPESDISDILVIYTQEKKALITASNEELIKKNDLFQWINLKTDTDKNFPLEHQTSLHTIDSIDNIDNNILVQFEKNKKDKLDVQHQQLLSNFLPRVTLGYSFGTFYSHQIANLSNTSFDFGNQLRNNKSQYLGLGLQIPIFSRGDNYKLRSLKKLQIKEQDLQIEKTKIDQTNLFSTYHLKLKQYQKLMPILTEALKYAENSLQTTQAKYNFGKVDISAYKSAKNQVLSSSYDIINNNLSIYMSENILKTLNTK